MRKRARTEWRHDEQRPRNERAATTRPNVTHSQLARAPITTRWGHCSLRPPPPTVLSALAPSHAIALRVRGPVWRAHLATTGKPHALTAPRLPPPRRAGGRPWGGVPRRRHSTRPRASSVRSDCARDSSSAHLLFLPSSSNGAEARVPPAKPCPSVSLLERHADGEEAAQWREGGDGGGRGATPQQASRAQRGMTAGASKTQHRAATSSSHTAGKLMTSNALGFRTHIQAALCLTTASDCSSPSRIPHLGSIASSDSSSWAAAPANPYTMTHRSRLQRPPSRLSHSSHLRPPSSETPTQRKRPSPSSPSHHRPPLHTHATDPSMDHRRDHRSPQRRRTSTSAQTPCRWAAGSARVDPCRA